MKLLIPVVIVAAFWVWTLWGFSKQLDRAEMVRLTAGLVVICVVPVALALVVGIVRGRLAQGRRPRRPEGAPKGRWSAGYATRLCPHGIVLRHANEAGRLLPWSDVADIRVFPASSGRGGVVAARLRSFTEPTGLPAVARIVEDGSVPDDPAWLWLGGVRDAAEGDRVAAQTGRWRETAPR
ncbi:hypothetical protein ACFY2R_13070 [Micromonospora olivasterospora]|uniref:hypothetical protein n=1 Tax=Micromonospora olivasterospora TaxID=1880 RepID=UPI0011A1B043|nr:hypothetical protein [Micromonospora olivasterospora]